MTTQIYIIAKREGKMYSLSVEVEAIWQPLDAREAPWPDLLPEQYVTLQLGSNDGWSNYEFGEPTNDDLMALSVSRDALRACITADAEVIKALRARVAELEGALENSNKGPTILGG